MANKASRNLSICEISAGPGGGVGMSLRLDPFFVWVIEVLSPLFMYLSWWTYGVIFKHVRMIYVDTILNLWQTVHWIVPHIGISS